jgi:16S rRNA (adenine1518-N6/adenine1519-N6)-dimethyltransferase
MREAGLAPRRALGQHFLLDDSLLRLIADAGSIEDEDTVLEVGIGLGSLTRILCERAVRVVAVELDENIVRHVRPQLEGVAGLEIITGDILAGGADLNPQVLSALGDAKRVKLIANLPFQVATRLLLILFRVLPAVESGVVIVQREVALRLVAQPGSKSYGPAGLLLGFWATAKRLRDLPPGAFRPPPKVTSSILRVERRAEPLAEAALYASFSAWVDRLFQQRRKQIGGLLRQDLGEKIAAAALQSMDVAPEARPETLVPEAFVELARKYPRA